MLQIKERDRYYVLPCGHHGTFPACFRGGGRVRLKSEEDVRFNLKRKWTPEEDNRLLRMSAAKKPRALIGTALRRTTAAAAARLIILRHELARTRQENRGQA